MTGGMGDIWNVLISCKNACKLFLTPRGGMFCKGQVADFRAVGGNKMLSRVWSGPFFCSLFCYSSFFGL